jgi:hypothetical protein
MFLCCRDADSGRRLAHIKTSDDIDGLLAISGEQYEREQSISLRASRGHATRGHGGGGDVAGRSKKSAAGAGSGRQSSGASSKSGNGTGSGADTSSSPSSPSPAPSGTAPHVGATTTAASPDAPPAAEGEPAESDAAAPSGTLDGRIVNPPFVHALAYFSSVTDLAVTPPAVAPSSGTAVGSACILLAALGDGRLVAYDTPDSASKVTFALPRRVGSAVAHGGAATCVGLLRLPVTATAVPLSAPSTAVIPSGSRQVIVSAGNDGRICLWDVASVINQGSAARDVQQAAPLVSIQHGKGANAILCIDGVGVFVADVTKTITLYSWVGL